jgi:NAD-dependent SIR2 family protein deacetylase
LINCGTPADGHKVIVMEPDIIDRVISLGAGLAAVPERLLLAHARGEVLFICGAGISRPANLPDFRELVLDVYKALDAGVYAVLNVPNDELKTDGQALTSNLTHRQMAEAKRFMAGDYDVVLGMLERRLDEQT